MPYVVRVGTNQTSVFFLSTFRALLFGPVAKRSKPYKMNHTHNYTSYYHYRTHIGNVEQPRMKTMLYLAYENMHTMF